MSKRDRETDIGGDRQTDRERETGRQTDRDSERERSFKRILYYRE